MRSSIFIKVLFLCLTISVITVLLMFYTSFSQTKKHLYIHANINLKEKSTLMMKSVDRFINERLGDIKMLSKVPAIINGCQNTYELGLYVDSFVRDNKIYESISFFDLRRKRIYDSRGLAIGLVHTKSKYWNSLDSQDHALDISHSESLLVPVMHFAQKVFNKDGQHIGYIVARMRIENLYHVFEDYIENDHNQIDQIEVNLLDTNGVFLYSNIYKDKILTEKYFQYSLIEKSIPSSEKQIPCQIVDSPEKLFFVHGQNGFGDYKGSKWLLVLKIDKSAIYAPVYALRKILLGIAAFVLLLVTIIAITFTYFFTKPFSILSNAANEYGNGNFDYTFSLKTKDERQRLAETMTEMAFKLKTKINQQEYLHQTLITNMEVLNSHKCRIEEQNLYINTSLESALKLQNAMLTQITHTVNPFFKFDVFMKARNIVSGDYYFFHKIEDVQKGDQYIIALVDCTGHGVAGAFMAIMAHNLLSTIVVNEKVGNPRDILNSMNISLNEMLNYNDTGIHNGMDLAICSYNVKDNIVKFCGANRDLLIVNNACIISEHKGLRLSLGNSVSDNRTLKLFNSEEIEIQPSAGDRFYMYTDGITDQFGGDSDRKFSGKRLKLLLKNSNHLPFNQGFEYITNEFTDWKKDTPQTDDMLLMGFEFNELTS